MNASDAPTPPPPLPRWFGPRASADDPSVSALIGRVARGAEWADPGRVHAALRAVWEPAPPQPLDDHRTFGQLRSSVGFTHRRLGPGCEPVVERMRRLTGELAELRKEVELPNAPIHGDFKPGNAGVLSDGSWVTFDLDFARLPNR